MVQSRFLELVKAVSQVIDVPLIASGGAGKMEDFLEVFKAGADAALAASLFHFGTISLRDLRVYLSEEGIPVRPPLPNRSGNND